MEQQGMLEFQRKMKNFHRGLLVLTLNWTLFFTTVSGVPLTSTLGEPFRHETAPTATAELAISRINTTYSYLDSMIGGNMSGPILNTCILRPQNETELEKIKDTWHNGMKMVRYNLIVDGEHGKLHSTSHLYKPFSWVKVTGRQGAGLLLLKDHFDVLSSFTLRIGVRKLDVRLTETPEGCLNAMSITDAETLMRDAVMNGFYSTTVGDILTLEDTDQGCNVHVVNNEGYAEFRHYCCKRGALGDITCQYLEEGFWVSILFYVIAALKILIVLFSPRFVPGSLYRLKSKATPYVHKLANNIKLSLNVILASEPEHVRHVRDDTICFRLSKFKHMPEFTKTIHELRKKPGVSHRLELEAIHLKVDSDLLISENAVPVGLFGKLYETFVMCTIRENRALQPCCDANICRLSLCSCLGSWYRLMRTIMTLIVSTALITPWILRVTLYYIYEQGELDFRRKIANDLNLKLLFSGSYVSYLTPLHIVFIIIYVLLSLEFCIYGVLSKRVQEKFKFVLRRCFRDMREKDQGGVMAWAVRFALKPCTNYGGFGLCIGIVAWVIGLPFMAVFLAFYFLPTINITFRLSAHFVVYLLPSKFCRFYFCRRFIQCMDTLDTREVTGSESVERNERILKSRWGRLQQLFIILFCIISLYSVLFLLTEIIALGVEILVYTLMGVILNASKTLSYISLLLLLVVYANDCFGFVKKKILAFNRVLLGAIESLGEKQCEAVMYTPYEEQENMAFVLNPEGSSDLKDPIELDRDFEGHPSWSVSRLALYFSRNDIPHITRSLLSEACKMHFSFVPGNVFYNYLRAAFEFGIIIIFLLFVLLVVFAFGDSYEISASNQLLATVAGGLLPLLLKKIFKQHTVPTIKDDSVQFKIYMHDLLANFKQIWPIHDIIARPVYEIPSNGVTPADKSKDRETVVLGVTVSDSDSHAVKANGGVTDALETRSDSNTSDNHAIKVNGCEIDGLNTRSNGEVLNYDDIEEPGAEISLLPPKNTTLFNEATCTENTNIVSTLLEIDTLKTEASETCSTKELSFHLLIDMIGRYSLDDFPDLDVADVD